jgi:hypothetical protein
MGGMSGNGTFDATENSPEQWARMLDSSSGKSGDAVKESAYLYSSGMLDEYEEDTLKLNSDYTQFDEGSRVGKVTGRNLENDYLEREMNVEVVRSHEMSRDVSMAEIEQQAPEFRSAQIIMYSLMPKGFEKDGDGSDFITASTGQETINNHDGGFEVDHSDL